MYEDAALLAKKTRLALMRERHNALAEIEDFCGVTPARMKRYAKLLQHLAKVKKSIRIEMDAEWTQYRLEIRRVHELRCGESL